MSQVDEAEAEGDDVTCQCSCSKVDRNVLCVPSTLPHSESTIVHNMTNTQYSKIHIDGTYSKRTVCNPCMIMIRSAAMIELAISKQQS